MTNPIAPAPFYPSPRHKQPLTVQGRSLLTIFPSQSCRAVYTSDHAYFFLHANRIIQHMASVTRTRLHEVLLHSLGEDRLSWSSFLKSAHPFWKSLSRLQEHCCDRDFRWNAAWRDSNRQTAQRGEMYTLPKWPQGFPICTVLFMMQSSKYKNSFSTEIL